MAAGNKKVVKRVSFLFMQKLAASVFLLSFIVLVVGGMMGGARIITITYRAAGVLIVIGAITRVIIKILESYEEMNSGKS